MKITKKRYLKLEIELASSLSIGSGENGNTDHDILVNANGEPYIPGSAIAGVTRHALAEAGILDRAQDRQIFGDVVINREEPNAAKGKMGDADNTKNFEEKSSGIDLQGKAEGRAPAEGQSKNSSEAALPEALESRIVTYDVILKPQKEKGKYYISNRDMVALDGYKTAINGSKFDMEVLEPGVIGTVIFEENQFNEKSVSSKADRVNDEQARGTQAASEQDSVSKQDIEKNEIDVLEKIAQVWNSGMIRFGAKTTRGYGEIKVKKAQEIEFDFKNPEHIVEWLKFTIWKESAQEASQTITSQESASQTDVLENDKDNDKSKDSVPKWEDCKNLEANETGEIKLELKLKQVGGISIRRYTTDPKKGENDNAPDFVQLTYHEKLNSGQNEVSDIEDPVIPGTSWSGAFRHAIEQFFSDGNDKKLISTYFGSADKKSKAKIYFSESRVTGGYNKIFTRCAINRFTGGAKTGALYTESTYYGGTTTLTITLKEEKDSQINDETDASCTSAADKASANKITESEKFKNALAAAIVDLNEGILAVGGETAIGRGLFKIEEINGESAKVKAQDIFSQVKEALERNDKHEEPENTGNGKQAGCPADGKEKQDGSR